MRKRTALFGLLITCSILCSSCAFPFVVKDENIENGMDLLAGKSSPTLTPFQPVPPTLTPSITPTPRPSSTPWPTFTPIPTFTPTFTPTLTNTATFLHLIGAGDISICGQDGDDQTAKLLADQPGFIFTLGDSQNDEAELWRYEDCFAKSWGQYKERMIPVIGNHDYYTENASGFYDYFGDMAGPRGKGYYSRDIGDWHIIALNSNCDQIGGCDSASEMARWLEQDLQQNQKLCTVAFWHVPRWSSGYHGNDTKMDPIWRLVARYGVEMVLNGHDHFYERFSPMNENGDIDHQNGTRSFIVGTGGAYMRGVFNPSGNSELNDASTFGVMALTLGSDWYSWKFIPAPSGGFTDSGQDVCH